MKVVALVSGGKDSCFNMLHCVSNGHEIIAIANLSPPKHIDELDSYMYQTVGHEMINLYSQAMDVPLFQQTISGTSIQVSSTYTKTTNDEVEDLYTLLKKVRDVLPDVQGVSVGAILSDYQRVRVEDVCNRLGLISLSYLWRQDQLKLLDTMIKCNMDCILVKVASLGLNRNHLMKNLKEMQPLLEELNSKFGVHPCGEGGEYESMTQDCPFDRFEIISDSLEKDAIAPVAYARILESHLVDKLLVSFEKEISLLQSLHAIDYPKLKYDVDLNKTSMVKFRKDHSRITRRPLLYKSGSMLYFPATGFPNAPSIELETREILSLIVKHLTEIGSSLNDILLVTIYIKNMTEFPLLNKIYNEFFNIPNPPARVTVSACIESNIEIEFIATTNPKLAMHVQSHSYWAPANIGPYSQVNSVLDQVYCAGQIPLIPSSMKLVVCDDLQSTLNNQVFLSLQHVSAILDPVKSSILQIVYGICYITDLNYISLAEEYWLERTEKAAVCFVVVDQLPRDAFVEWHVVSSTSTYTCRFNHNNEVVGSIFGSVAGFFIHLKRDLEFFDEKLAIVGHEVEWSNIVFGRVFYTSLVTAEMLQELMAKLSSVGCEAVSFVPCAYLDEKIVTVLLQFQVDK